MKRTACESDALLEGITRQNVAGHRSLRLHIGQSVAQANIELLEIHGKRFVLKDFYHHHPLVRYLWGRRIIAREWRMYKLLEGIPGIPRALCRLDEYSFIVEYIEGRSLSHRHEAKPEPSVFERLKQLTNAIHKRGITHGDLRRKNILITAEGQPYLIDFAGAFALNGSGNFLIRAVFQLLKKVDDITVLKLQNYYLPGSLKPEEFRLLANIPWYLKLGRFLRKKVYPSFKHATMKRAKKDLRNINLLKQE